MRIHTGQTTHLFKAFVVNNNTAGNHPDEGQRPGIFMRTDAAAISAWGKSANLLANLMNQRELIQMNKDALIKHALEDESSAAGLKEQMEEYEEQLDKLDEQIASEMAKQAETEAEKDSLYEKPQGTDTSNTAHDSTVKLTEMSTRLESTHTISQAQIRRDGEKRVCESEKELGSAAAKTKLEKINKMESLTGQVMPFIKNIMDTGSGR